MRVKTDAKRQAILDAAAAVLREQGFAGASMTAVSARVGASKATLYRYFTSKEDLFLTVLLDSAHDQAAKVFETLRPSGNLRGVLQRFGARFLELTLSSDVLAVRRILIAEGSRSGLGQRLFERGPQVTWSKMAAFVEQEVARGRLRGGDSWIMAMHLRGLLESDIVNRALLGAEIDTRLPALKRHADRAIDAWLRAYGPDRATDACPTSSVAQNAATRGGAGTAAPAAAVAGASLGSMVEPT